MKSDRYRKGVPPVFVESQPKYLQDELTKLERVLDLGYEDITKVNADGAVLHASINHERTLRATGDEALAQDILTLTATVDSDRIQTAALVSTETTARATQTSALAQQITTLQTYVNTQDATLDASIVAERTARSTQDTALATSIMNLSATVTTNKGLAEGATTTVAANLTTEQTTRATADTALSTSITNLSATVTTNKTNAEGAIATVAANLTTEQTTRATADTALSTSITNLSSTVTTNKTNADGAIATVAANLTTEQTTRATQDTALSNSISSLTATVNGNNTAVNARVDSEASARATGDSANATSITNLSTTVNGHTSSISTLSSSIDGVAARWGVRINNNGRVAGVLLNSSSTGSNFDIEADTFNIYKPGTTERGLYWDGSQLVVRGNILATSITAESVNILGSNAVNRPVIGNPNVIASGTYAGGGTSDGFTVYIPTGQSVDSGWSTASTNQYLATATIAGGISNNGGRSGWAHVSVCVGDSLETSAHYPTDNEIYIRYQFYPGDAAGGFNATSISWKLVRV